jgi:hypothetical protein
MDDPEEEGEEEDMEDDEEEEEDDEGADLVSDPMLNNNLVVNFEFNESKQIT